MTEFAIAKTEEEAEAKAKLLPHPATYRILCAIPAVESTFGGKIAKADESVRVEELTSVVLFVLKMGPTAGLDPVKFPSGPPCKEGDFIITRSYTGTRFKIYGKEFRLIDDDQVCAVVDDPRGISRA